MLPEIAWPRRGILPKVSPKFSTAIPNNNDGLGLRKPLCDMILCRNQGFIVRPRRCPDEVESDRSEGCHDILEKFHSCLLF